MWANSSGVPPTKFQWSAYFAVMGSVRFSPLPPMQIGGCGFCGPFGSLRASVELVVLAVERRGLLGQQAGQHLTGLLEAVEPLLDGAEFDAVGAGFLFVPARADAELEAAVGDDVECRGHVGEHRGMAVVDPGDQDADT